MVYVGALVYHAKTNAAMQLNIKNAEAGRLARAVASRTGVSLTEAITVALRDKLELLDRQRSIAERDLEIQEIQDRVADALARAGRRAPSQKEMDEADYDSAGLPR